MTVSSALSKSGPYAGAGTAGPFVVSFRFLENAHLLVVRTSSTGVQTALVLNIDFTAIGAGTPSGGTVTTTVPVAVGQTLTITRQVPITQLTDYTQSDSFPAESHEDALDKLTMIAQEHAADLAATLRIPEEGVEVPLLPPVADRAGRILGFDENGDPVGILPTAGDATSLALDLLSTSTSAKGAGQIGFLASLSYGVGTVGRFLKDLTSSVGSALVGYSQGGASSITLTVQTKLRETVSVKDFGAVGDGVTDDTVAINLALQATVAFGSTVPRRVYFPAGNYLVTGPLYLRAGCEMVGEGFTASRITSTGFVGVNPVVRMGYGLIAGVPTSDASGLVPCVSGIYFSGLGCGIDTTGQSGFAVRDCWFNNVLGINLAGSDGRVSNCTFDTSCTTGIQDTGSRNLVSNAEFIGGVGSNFGVAFSTPTFTTISQTSYVNCLFYGLRQQSVYAFATAIIDDVKFIGCTFSTNYNAGVRTAGQTHFLTQVGVVFKRIEFVGCSFEYALENDVAINGGTGIVSFKSCSFSYTGIVDGGASYALKHSILADVLSGPTYLVRDCDFNLVGGASIRLGGVATKARISNCHNIGCGTGGTTLAASANEGDKAHIQIRNGTVDVQVSDCSTDSTALYVVGTFNGSYFTGRHNRSARADYDTHAVAPGGTYFGERNSGGCAVAVVASAAALTLPFQGTETPVFSITGTTNITSVVATGWEGRTVRLIFAGILTFTDGSNLKIAGNLVTTGDDVIVLTCFGGNWYECSRSVN